MTDLIGGGNVFSAIKKGTTLELSSDPDPGGDSYLVIDAPGMLVLLAQNGRDTSLLDTTGEHDAEAAPDRDAQLRHAFAELGARVAPSVLSSSFEPKSTLTRGFRALAEQPCVREDVGSYIAANPSVVSAVDMLFTSIAMSARADWRAAPAHIRGVVARGWFLGRWVPTFLVLDGPILRLLNSAAFRQQEGSAEFLRAVRAFFHARDFMTLRHGFAHWSFSWAVDGEDSEIVVHGHGSTHEVRVFRREVDAFHILTFAVVEALHESLLRSC